MSVQHVQSGPADTKRNKISWMVMNYFMGTQKKKISVLLQKGLLAISHLSFPLFSSFERVLNTCGISGY